MARLAPSLLGPLLATLDGLAYDNVRALLAYLAIETRPHGRDALSEQLWIKQVPAARRSLRMALTILRRARGAQTTPVPFLIGTGESVQVNRASAIALDLTSFGELLRECASHVHAGERMSVSWVARVARWVLNRIGWLARS